MIERIEIKNRGQWLAQRRQDITASEIATLFGLHPYRTALQVFLSKSGGDADEGENKAMRRGRILEPGIPVAIADERPTWRMTKATVYIRDTETKIGATPDYFLHDPDCAGDGILECKTAAPEWFERDWADGPPQYATLQCLTQMMLDGAAYGVIACLVDNRAKDLFLYDVPRHPKAEALIRHKAAQFWAAIAADTPPAPDYRRDADAIMAMFPKGGGSALNLTGDNRMPELLETRAALKQSIAADSADLEAIDAEIKHKLGDAAEAFLPGWKLSYKLQQRAGYTVSPTEFRALRITKLKEKADASA